MPDLSLSLARAIKASAAPHWVPRDMARHAALFAADISNDRGWHAGRHHASLAGLLSSVGGLLTDGRLTVPPDVFGDERVLNGTALAGTDGWTAIGGSLSASAGLLVHTNNTGAGAVLQAWTPVAVAAGSMVRVALRVPNGVTRELRFVNDSNTVLGVIDSGLGIGTHEIYVAVPAGATRLMLRTATVAAGAHAQWGDISVRQCRPFAGFTTDGFSVVVEATSGPSVTSNQCLLQIGGDDEDQRLRIALESDGHLHFSLSCMTAASASVERFNLDIGALAPDAAFKVAISCTNGAYGASLDGRAAMTAPTANHPPAAFMRTGADTAGSNIWGGTVEKVAVFQHPRTADFVSGMANDGDAIAVLGDSFVSGAGGVVLPSMLAIATHRPVVNLGQGADTMQNSLSRFGAVPGYHGHVLIVWDGRRNGWIDLATYRGCLADIVSRQANARYLVIPPVASATDGDAYIEETVAIRDAIAADHAHRLVDWRDVLSTDTIGGRIVVASGELLDGVHLTSTAMAKIIAALAARLSSI